MFGGFNGTNFNDLWKYTPSSTRGVAGTWKLMAGSPSMPGPLAFPAFSTDANGNLWLFGGQGAGGGYFGGYSNSLWKYTPSTGGWTLVSGFTSASTKGVYGTKGVPSTANYPPPLSGAVSWIDAQGNFWLFGGQGGYAGWLGDTWEYVQGAGWAWMGGTGLFSETNASQCTNSATPSSRVGASAWTDAKGNFWLFGGYGCDSKGNVGLLNDLWQSSGNGNWSMVNGSPTAGATGNYGTQFAPAATDEPPGRTAATAWTDLQGNLWLFGGATVNVWQARSSRPVASSLLNDLWEYKPGSGGYGSGNWTWISLGPNANGGMLGGRYGAVAWPQASAFFWLFGGWGVQSQAPGIVGFLSDLWSSSGVVY